MPSEDMTSIGQPITFGYTNWRGEVATRTAVPKRLWFGVTDWHPEPGWLMTAYDLAKAADRDFALADCVFAAAAKQAAQSDAGSADSVTLAQAAQMLLDPANRLALWDAFGAAGIIRSDKLEAALRALAGEPQR